MLFKKLVPIATLASTLILCGVATSQAQTPPAERGIKENGITVKQKPQKPAKLEIAVPAVVEKGIREPGLKRSLETVAPTEPDDAKAMSDSDDTDSDAPQQRSSAFKQALTWKVAKTKVVGGKTYVLMSHDYGPGHMSNPYVGDTGINQRRSLLCLKKSEKPTAEPAGLKPFNVTTPGGALAYSWSSAKMIAIPNVLGSD